MDNTQTLFAEGMEGSLIAYNSIEAEDEQDNKSQIIRVAVAELYCRPVFKFTQNGLDHGPIAKFTATDKRAGTAKITTVNTSGHAKSGQYLACSNLQEDNNCAVTGVRCWVTDNLEIVSALAYQTSLTKEIDDTDSFDPNFDLSGDDWEKEKEN